MHKTVLYAADEGLRGQNMHVLPYVTMGHYLCFTDESKLDSEICSKFGCWQTPPGVMAFCYRFSSKHAAMGDIHYMVESVFSGEGKWIDGKRMSLKLSRLTIVQ